MAEKKSSPPSAPKVAEASITRPSKPFDGAMDGAVSRSDSVGKSIRGGAEVIPAGEGRPTPLTVNSAAPPPPPPQQGKSKK
jgi:hypothetical protein